MAWEKFSKRIAGCMLCKKFAGVRVTKPAGTSKGKILFLLPAPSAEECARDALFSCVDAATFTQVLKKYANFDIHERALIVPLTFCKTTLTKLCTENCAEHVNRLVRIVEPKIVCVIGGDVYRAYFKHGKMLDTLFGRKLELPEFPFTFFFFSDYKKMSTQIPMDDSGEPVVGDDGNIEVAYDMYWLEKIRNQARAFKVLLEEKKCKAQ